MGTTPRKGKSKQTPTRSGQIPWRGQGHGEWRAHLHGSGLESGSFWQGSVLSPHELIRTSRATVG